MRLGLSLQVAEPISKFKKAQFAAGCFWGCVC
jgi:hypothetical protein